jgi:hypothetical protein
MRQVSDELWKAIEDLEHEASCVFHQKGHNLVSIECLGVVLERFQRIRYEQSIQGLAALVGDAKPGPVHGG